MKSDLQTALVALVAVIVFFTAALIAQWLPFHYYV